MGLFSSLLGVVGVVVGIALAVSTGGAALALMPLGVIGTVTAAGFVTGAIGYGLGSLTDMALSMPEIAGSSTYASNSPVTTTKENVPIAWCYGFCQIAGNIVRANDPTEETLKLIVCHSLGEIDSILSWKFNNIEFENMESYDDNWLDYEVGTFTQTKMQKSGDDFFGIRDCAYRGRAYTAVELKKDSQVNGTPGVLVTGRFRKCSPISATDDPKVFSRNPAVIMWDFYRNIEGYAIAELDLNGFKSLEALCDEYPAGDGARTRPPGPTSSRVRATSSNGDKYKPVFSTDIIKPIEGPWKRAQWLASEGSTTNQCFNVDLGIAGILTKITLINGHDDGERLTAGIKDFTLWGSNSSLSMLNTSYALNTYWTAISGTLTATQYDEDDPEQDYETSVQTTAYRYFRIKITDNHGHSDWLGFRDVTFHMRSPRYTFDFNFDNKININDAKKLIWRSFNGACIRSQGKIKPIWDFNQIADGSGGLTTKTSKHSFTMDNIVKGSLTWFKPDRPNVFTVQYIDSHRKYIKTSFKDRDDSDVDERGEFQFDETCWFITKEDVARRRVKQRFNKAIYTDYICKLSAFSDSSDLEILDLVEVTHTLPGWTSKKFIITDKSEDAYGRPSFTLEAYFSGVYGDQQTAVPESYFSRYQDPNSTPLPSTDISADAAATSTEWDANGIVVSFTPPAEDAFYSHTEIYASTDDINYQLVGISSGEDFTIPGNGTIYAPGDTVYIKLVNVNEAGIKEPMPDDADDSIVISSTTKMANFYAGLNDFWGGNAAIDNAATTIVLGNLDGTSKIALGASADILTISNMATYPGFFADGAGNVRGGNAGGGFVSTGGTFLISGSLVACELHIPDQDITANSFHIDTDGDTWWGCTETNFTADNDNANAYILKTGSAKFHDITATGGTVGGWTLAAGKISITGIELDKDNSRIRIGTGATDYVDITPSYIRGVSNTFGTTFDLPTDGSAPTFSSGTIKETVYEMYTSGIIKTDSDPASNGGLLVNSTSLKGYSSAGLKLIELVYDGTDQGDVYFGDYDNSNAGIKYDHSEGDLNIRLASGGVFDLYGGLNVKTGADITLEHAATNPGKIYLTKVTDYDVSLYSDNVGGTYMEWESATLGTFTMMSPQSILLKSYQFSRLYSGPADATKQATISTTYSSGSSYVNTVLYNQYGYDEIGTFSVHRDASGGYFDFNEYSTSGKDLLINLSLNSVNKFTFGLDNSDSDKFKFASGSDLTTSTFLTIDTSGNLTLLNGTSINEFSTDGTLAGDSDDAVPTEKAVKTFVGTQSLKGDGTAGRALRKSILKIEDGTNSNTIKCTLTAGFNGDTISETDNIPSGGTSGYFLLGSGGEGIMISNSGLSGKCIDILSTNLRSNTTGTQLLITGMMWSDDFYINPTNTSGSNVDIAALVNSGAVQIEILYVTDA